MRRMDTLFNNLRIIQANGVDIGNINSNSTLILNIAAAGVILGTHIISWEPVSDASSIEDLQIQFVVITTGQIRATYSNPTGGAIDPDAIDMQFFVGEANPNIVEVL